MVLKIVLSCKWKYINISSTPNADLWLILVIIMSIIILDIESVSFSNVFHIRTRFVGEKLIISDVHILIYGVFVENTDWSEEIYIPMFLSPPFNKATQ